MHDNVAGNKSGASEEECGGSQDYFRDVSLEVTFEPAVSGVDDFVGSHKGTPADTGSILTDKVGENSSL